MGAHKISFPQHTGLVRTHVSLSMLALTSVAPLTVGSIVVGFGCAPRPPPACGCPSCPGSNHMARGLTLIRPTRLTRSL